MSNFGNWQGVNVGAINGIIANAMPINDKAEEAAEKKDSRTVVEITKQYDWENEVVSHSLWWDTPQISHIIKYIADQIFDDVESAFVDYNPRTNSVQATLYFKYNAAKKSEDGILAFTSVNRMPGNNAVEQYMRISAQQKFGDTFMTKEGQEIISDWLYLPGVNKSNNKWITNINWTNYVDIVPSQSETGVSIRLSGLDVSAMIGMIINHQTVETTDASGKPVTLEKRLDVVVIPGRPKKDNAIEKLFEVIITDHERAESIIGEINGNQSKFARSNPYQSYI